MRAKKYVSGIFRMLGYLILLIVLVLLTAAVTEKKKQVLCRAIVPSIQDSAIVRFISDQEIKDILREKQGRLLGMPLHQINTAKIETILLKHPYIKKVEAYKDVDGTLHIDILQRNPLVRIYLPGRPGFFIDDQGYILPWTSRYPVHVLVASGRIPVPSRMSSFKTIYDMPEQTHLQDIYRLACYIDSVRFWKAQIEEIFVDNNQEYALTPRVGSHAIILGDMENYKEKFRKLYLFYTHVLNNKGWNRYTTINLNFKDQIVCTKRN
ncbi:MAG: hypothetical protein J7K46_08305 [Bacteroidales bacterium]|nr:hypothetical protein [Bacteroidales bacterium]